MVSKNTTPPTFSVPIKLPKVMQYTTLARSTIYGLIREGAFPKPFKIAKRTSVWDEQEVMDYISACKEAS